MNESDLIARLRELDGPADESEAWFEPLWQALHAAGASGWARAAEPDGRAELLARYVAVAEGSLAAALILTQHDGGVRRLLRAAAGSAPHWAERVASGQAFVTVGIAQLTTSQRKGPRAVVAARQGDHFRIDGTIPWVTAARRADVIVVGAVLDDDENQQVLIALPTDRPGVRIGDDFPLAALRATATVEVTCDGVILGPDEVIAGPEPQVLGTATGGLETSALALGQARAAINALALVERWQGGPAQNLAREQAEALATLDQLARDKDLAPARAAGLRQRSNDLALRTTQAYLLASKGSGLIRPHPAQRWARQALFFLVWSCPAPVVEATMNCLAPAS